MLACLVGAAGFEPATFRPPAERATKLRHAPVPASLRQLSPDPDAHTCSIWGMLGEESRGGAGRGGLQRGDNPHRAGDRTRTGTGSLEGSCATATPRPRTALDYRFGPRGAGPGARAV